MSPSSPLTSACTVKISTALAMQLVQCSDPAIAFRPFVDPEQRRARSSNAAPSACLCSACSIGGESSGRSSARNFMIATYESSSNRILGSKAQAFLRAVMAMRLPSPATKLSACSPPTARSALRASSCCASAHNIDRSGASIMSSSSSISYC